MKQSTHKNSNSTLVKQAAAVAGGVFLVSAVAYWFFRRPQGAKLLNEKIRAMCAKSPDSKHFGDGTRDAVDQAGWESFPASDPPAHNSFH